MFLLLHAAGASSCAVLRSCLPGDGKAFVLNAEQDATCELESRSQSCCCKGRQSMHSVCANIFTFFAPQFQTRAKTDSLLVKRTTFKWQTQKIYLVGARVSPHNAANVSRACTQHVRTFLLLHVQLSESCAGGACPIPDKQIKLTVSAETHTCEQCGSTQCCVGKHERPSF